MRYVHYNNNNVYPNKIVCVGRNYIKHIKELENEVPEEIVIFFKPNSSIGYTLMLPKETSCHYEGELSFLYKNNSLAYVSFGLDLTKREIQRRLKEKGLPWERAKSFRNAAFFSEFVSFKNIEDLSLELYINGNLKQKGSVTHMINKPLEIIQEVLTFSHLDDNDIIMSGTPSGVGEIKPNDVLVGRVLEKNNLLVEKEWLAS